MLIFSGSRILQRDVLKTYLKFNHSREDRERESEREKESERERETERKGEREIVFFY